MRDRETFGGGTCECRVKRESLCRAVCRNKCAVKIHRRSRIAESLRTASRRCENTLLAPEQSPSDPFTVSMLPIDIADSTREPNRRPNCGTIGSIRSIIFAAVLVGVVALHRPLGADACQILVPAELLNACTFDALTLTVPDSGFVVDRESCNDVVDKETFVEQPYVYFGGAADVRIYAFAL